MTIKALYPSIRPTLNLDFAKTKALDPRVTFTRASPATFVDSNGLIQTAASGAARFDHNPATGESLGLLVEEARTNSIWPSEPTTASARNITGNPGNAWAVYDGTVTSSAKNGITGLEVTISSTLDNNGFTGGNAIPWGGIGGGGTVTSGATASISFFINPLTWTGNIYLAALFGDSNNTFDPRTFQLFNNGIYTNSASYVKKVFADGTYWLSGIPFSSLFLYTATQPFLVVYTTTTGDNAKKYWAGGFQWEAGAFSTSYIPTTTATVTRAADVASMSGTNFSSWYSATPQSWLVKYKTPYVASGSVNPTILKHGTIGLSGNGPAIRVNTSTSSLFWDPLTSPEIFRTADFSKNMLQGIYATAFDYPNGTLSQSFGGEVSATTFTGRSSPSTTSMTFGACSGSSYAYLNGTIAQLTYYPIKLSNTQLQALTAT